MADIVKFEAGKISADMFASANDQFKESAPDVDTSGGVAFLKLERGKNKWTFGQDEKEVPADSLWAVYPQSFATGFVAWQGAKVFAKAMASIGEPPINEADLPPAPADSDGWEENVGVAFVCVECKSQPDLVGTHAIFENRSKGAIEGWTKLYDSVVARAKAGNETFAAVVQLDASIYDHKKFGKVSKPKFTIDSWEDPNDLNADFGDSPRVQSRGLDDAKDGQIEPASRRRQIETSKVEDAEVTGETPAPRRRRQRSQD